MEKLRIEINWHDKNGEPFPNNLWEIKIGDFKKLINKVLAHNLLNFFLTKKLEGVKLS